MGVLSTKGKVNRPVGFSPAVIHEKYFIWKRDGRTGQSSNKGKTMSFQLVLILVCLSMCVCTCIRDDIPVLKFTEWIFFFLLIQ